MRLALAELTLGRSLGWALATVNKVWSWDITYMRAPVRGSFFYLYLVDDLFEIQSD